MESIKHEETEFQFCSSVDAAANIFAYTPCKDCDTYCKQLSEETYNFCKEESLKSQIAKPKKAVKRSGGGRGSEGKELVKQLISEAQWTRDEIITKYIERFPERSPRTPATLLSDSKAEKPEQRAHYAFGPDIRAYEIRVGGKKIFTFDPDAINTSREAEEQAAQEEQEAPKKSKKSKKK